jgi:hypothetical protein
VDSPINNEYLSVEERLDRLIVRPHAARSALHRSPALNRHHPDSSSGLDYGPTQRVRFLSRIFPGERSERAVHAA